MFNFFVGYEIKSLGFYCLAYTVVLFYLKTKLWSQDYIIADNSLKITVWKIRQVSQF
jgi:hypothetical protein